MTPEEVRELSPGDHIAVKFLEVTFWGFAPWNRELAIVRSRLLGEQAVPIEVLCRLPETPE